MAKGLDVGGERLGRCLLFNTRAFYAWGVLRVFPGAQGVIPCPLNDLDSTPYPEDTLEYLNARM